eukprot:m51a1_g10636 putative activation domain containing protein (182) ;mRNA; r:75348-75940
MGVEVGQRETACTSDRGGVITTGGGFSGIFPAPQFQRPRVDLYLKSTRNLPDSSLFNNGGRGYPDVSLAGHNYPVVIGGNVFLLSGTSASAPVFAGMLSLINGERIKSGLPPVGWATPALWHLAAEKRYAFNDVTEGRNNCCVGNPPVCCPDGFAAAPGWDPVCGWGSVSLDRLMKVWSEL